MYSPPDWLTRLNLAGPVQEIAAAEKGLETATATGVDAATDLLKNLKTGEVIPFSDSLSCDE